ncbi:MAG: ATP-dependent DNA ligase [Nitrososphaerales archaeon]
MDFKIIADGYEQMTKTTSRIELTNILVGILKLTDKSEISNVAYLTQGKLYPDFVGIELGMAERTVMKVIEKVYGASQEKITSLLRKTGDIGDVANILSKEKAQESLFLEQLTVEKVYRALDDIARSSGPGSIDSRINKLAFLFNSSSGIEAKFLARFVTGKLRLGVADYTVLDALAIAFTGDKKNREKLERAYNLTSDLGQVADLLAKEGIAAIDKVRIVVGKPIRPMLAERMESSKLIIDQMGGSAVAEYKLDGERIQAHKTSKGQVILFSRRLEKITSHYPDVAKSLETLDASNFILEGEVVALDSEGKYLPFQELMHRRRKYGLEEAVKKYPTSLNVFDLLYLDSEEIADSPYSLRRQRLEKLLERSKQSESKRLVLVPGQKVDQPEQIDSLMEESLAAGCEGLVVKDTKSNYRAGARGFAWIKLKPEYMANVRDTLDLVIVGANHGMGRRAGHYGTFLLAAYDPDSDTFRTTTKIGTGFTDSDLQTISTNLAKLALKEKSARVDAKVTSDEWFEPKIVIEVIASEITLSPIYTAGLGLVREESGLALRFPKFTGKIRNDKSAEDATTVGELLEMYKKQIRQFKSEAKTSSVQEGVKGSIRKKRRPANC